MLVSYLYHSLFTFMALHSRLSSFLLCVLAPYSTLLVLPSQLPCHIMYSSLSHIFLVTVNIQIVTYFFVYSHAQTQSWHIVGCQIIFIGYMEVYIDDFAMGNRKIWQYMEYFIFEMLFFKLLGLKIFCSDWQVYLLGIWRFRWDI